MGRPDGIETDTSQLVLETSKETNNSKTKFGMNEGRHSAVRTNQGPRNDVMCDVLSTNSKMCLILEMKNIFIPNFSSIHVECEICVYTAIMETFQMTPATTYQPSLACKLVNMFTCVMVEHSSC